MIKRFLKAWLFTALFLLGCYAIKFPLVWFGDWFASLSFYQALLVVFTFVTTFSAVGYTWFAHGVVDYD